MFPNVLLGGIIAGNIGLLALYCESTMKAALYENRAVLKRRYENRALLIRARRSGGFHTYRTTHDLHLVVQLYHIFAEFGSRKHERADRRDVRPWEGVKVRFRPYAPCLPHNYENTLKTALAL